MLSGLGFAKAQCHTLGVCGYLRQIKTQKKTLEVWPLHSPQMDSKINLQKKIVDYDYDYDYWHQELCMDSSNVIRCV